MIQKIRLCYDFFEAEKGSHHVQISGRAYRSANQTEAVCHLKEFIQSALYPTTQNCSGKYIIPYIRTASKPLAWILSLRTRFENDLN